MSQTFKHPQEAFVEKFEHSFVCLNDFCVENPFQNIWAIDLRHHLWVEVFRLQ